jgi:hypothetical protein
MQLTYYLTSGLIDCKAVFNREDFDQTNLETLFSQIKSTDVNGGFTCYGTSERTHAFSLYLKTGDVNEPFLEMQNNDFTLYCSKNDQEVCNNLQYIIATISEKYRAQHFNCVSFHAAAAASPEGEGVVIFGDKGAGKTSALLTLCKLANFSIIGNDGALIAQKDTGTLTLLGGKKQLAIRTSTLSALFPHDLAVEQEAVLHAREEKILTTPEDLGISSQSTPVTLKLALRINIYKGSTPTISAIPNPKLELLRLHQNAISLICGGQTPLTVSPTRVSGFFPSLDTKDISAMRNNLLNTLVTQTNFYYVTVPDALLIPDIVKDLLHK